MYLPAGSRRGILGKRNRVHRLAVTALLLGALAVAGLPSTASAHPRRITDMYTVGSDPQRVTAVAELNVEHEGVMKITLFKRVNGKWRKVKTKTAQQSDQNPAWYTADFFRPNTNGKCQFRAAFMTPDHETSKKRTGGFYCRAS